MNNFYRFKTCSKVFEHYIISRVSHLSLTWRMFECNWLSHIFVNKFSFVLFCTKGFPTSLCQTHVCRARDHCTKPCIHHLVTFTISLNLYFVVSFLNIEAACFGLLPPSPCHVPWHVVGTRVNVTTKHVSLLGMFPSVMFRDTCDTTANAIYELKTQVGSWPEHRFYQFSFLEHSVYFLCRQNWYSVSVAVLATHSMI